MIGSIQLNAAESIVETIKFAKQLDNIHRALQYATTLEFAK